MEDKYENEFKGIDSKDSVKAEESKEFMPWDCDSISYMIIKGVTIKRGSKEGTYRVEINTCFPNFSAEQLVKLGYARLIEVNESEKGILEDCNVQTTDGENSETAETAETGETASCAESRLTESSEDTQGVESVQAFDNGEQSDVDNGATNANDNVTDTEVVVVNESDVQSETVEDDRLWYIDNDIILTLPDGCEINKAKKEGIYVIKKSGIIRFYTKVKLIEMGLAKKK